MSVREEQTSQTRPKLAALWMVGAVASFTSMTIAGRAISYEHDTFEIMFFRSLFGIFLVVSIASLSGSLKTVSTRRMDLHLIRNLSHFTGQNLWFWALAFVPLAQLVAIEFTSPIWTALMAVFILGERLTLLRIIAALIGFVGVLCVAQPDFSSIDPGVLAAAAAAIGFAGSAVFTRLLTRTETTTCIVFWLVVIQAILGGICAGIDGEITYPTAHSLPWLMMIGLAGLSAHFCLTTALSLAPASVVMPMDFVRLPLIALVGVVLYGEPISLMIVLGAALIIGGNWLNLAFGSKTSAASKHAIGESKT